MSALDSITDAIEQIGLAKIVFVILVLALALGYFFFYPKNGSITLTVKALDGDALPGAEVTLTDANGNTLPTTYSDDAGVASFKDVPPGDYSAAIDPGVGYGAATKSVSLASGGEAAESVSVERATSVSVLPQENPSFLFLSCEKKVLFELRNAGANEEQVQLVADGGLKDVFAAPSLAIVPPGGSAFVEGSFTASKAKVGDELKGKVRVKGTRSGVDFNFILDEAPIITVSPKKITRSPQEIII
ncbi:MAG: carboxypeptidase regulatory-like domain-containing protein [Candidatus Micrarchaeota archaeon]